MKHVSLLLISVLCVLIVPSMALAHPVSIGAKIGGGLSFLGGSDWKNALDWIGGNNKVRSGFTIDAFFHFQIGQGFCIQPEIAYSRMGGAYDYYEPYLFGNVDGTITESTLEVSLLLMPQFRAGKGRIHIFAGPDLIFILGDIEYKETATGLTFSVDVEPDNTVVLGAKAGIGYAHPIGRGDLVIDFSYTRTLTKIFYNDNTAVNSLLLTAGYQIGL